LTQIYRFTGINVLQLRFRLAGLTSHRCAPFLVAFHREGAHGDDGRQRRPEAQADLGREQGARVGTDGIEALRLGSELICRVASRREVFLSKALSTVKLTL
jgi:hypothetical protein